MSALISISFILFFCALGAADSIATEAATPQMKWTSYHNERFGQIADVPKDWIMQPPPDNGDGLIFLSPDGKASVAVSGSHHLPDGDDRKTILEPNEGEQLIYRHKNTNEFIKSVKQGPDILYEKHILACRGEVWNSVYIKYPIDQKEIYAPIVNHITQSLRHGDVVPADNCMN